MSEPTRTRDPEADPAGPPSPRRGGYWRACGVLLLLGLVGVLSLWPMLGPMAREIAARLAAQPGAPEVPLPLLRAALLINPVVLLLAGVAVGTLLAPRLGLRSHLADWARTGRRPGPGLRAELPEALLWGIAAAALVLLMDAASRPFLGETAAALEEVERAQPRTLSVTLSGMLYGGITEELIVRWGVLSLLAWVLWRLAQRGRGHPRAWIGWTAIAVSAVLFGAAHLGAVGAQLPLTPGLVARTVTLNVVAGVVFGWLFWRRSLEAAMAAHAVGHVVFTAAAWARVLLGAGGGA